MIALPARSTSSQVRESGLITLGRAYPIGQISYGPDSTRA